MRYCIRICLLSIVLLLPAACGLPGTASGPPPTATPLLAPYTAAIATAEAGSDAVTQAAAYYERGNQQFELGDYAAAIADYSRAVELDPTHARAFNNRGLAHSMQENSTAALDDFTTAIRLDPAYARAHKNRLRLLEQQGTTATAAEQTMRELAEGYAQLAELEPANRAGYLYRQGSVLYGLRDFAGARRAFDTALAAEPQQVDALYERALLNLAEHQTDAAIADLDAALRLSPRAANAYYARGIAYSRTGDQERAIADFDAALQLRAEYAEALLGRAVAHHAAGNSAAAQADLDRLAQLTLDETLETTTEALRRALAEEP
jgi:tetratricopeptide (TPR) repeat protein